MKIEIPDYKPKTIYKYFMGVIGDEYEKLKKKYGTIPIIYGADEIYRLSTQWQLVKMFPEMHETDRFVSEYLKLYNPNSFMHTQLIGCVNNELGKDVIQYIWAGHAQLVDRLFSGLNHLDVLEDFVRVSLRHEYGHCLHNRKIFESTGFDVDKTSKIIHVMAADRENGMKKLTESYTAVGKIPDENYYKVYHSLPMEKEADEIMGLTFEDHWRSLQILDDFD